MGQGSEDADSSFECQEGRNELRALMFGVDSYGNSIRKNPTTKFLTPDVLRVNAMKILYQEAVDAKIRSVIKCPACGKDLVKTTYNKVFHSHKLGKSGCKDKYWNTVEPTRFNRMKEYYKD